LVDPLGGKEPLRPRLAPFSMGSDHQVWSEGSWRVPAIYLNDWPDRYIHTTGDTIANLDATKLLRAAYLGAASAWVLASLDTEGLPALWQVVRGEALERTAAAWRRAATLRAGGDAGAASTLLTGHFARERSVLPSAARFADLPPAMLAEAVAFFDGLEGAVAGAGAADAAGVAPSPAPQAAAAAAIVYRRSGPPGPMTAFGYSWLDDQLARRDLPQPALLSVTTPWADGALLAYEALNLIDGRRGVATVYEQLASAYGPLPLAAVADYLAILGQVGVLAAADLQEATSRLGEPLLRPELSLPSQVHQESHLARARARLAAHPDDPDAWVWVGRRLAYLGRYREALAVYDRGLARHPDDAALLRHRGHRNLTLRRLDAAAADLERAAALVEGRPDVVERDGLPNLADVPTSTLQTNVWYHLALARWLQGDFAAARDAWRRCLDLAEHPDMQVAAAYWLYLAHRRLSEDEAAAAVAARFGPDLELLESHDYHRLLGVFRGETDPAVLLAEAAEGGELSLATTAYGLGAWALLEGDRETADARFRQAVAAGPWAAFGALAAEAELARSRQPPPPDDAL
ncbi:MAG TPA: tetratricopeptide repeat protein, partial [Thermoanaerobaculia bacterium]|nr:tetratricopeptide repeat protein [Thermoanaerobaculia bacterium]